MSSLGHQSENHRWHATVGFSPPGLLIVAAASIQWTIYIFIPIHLQLQPTFIFSHFSFNPSPGQFLFDNEEMQESRRLSETQDLFEVSK